MEGYKKVNEESKIPLVAVVGPTASGKSALAVELAIRFGGEVISADSMQIYKRMDIGTAKPTAEEMRGVTHHLINIAEPSELFSVVDYVERAKACIEDICSRGKLPILAGGTGLYIRSLLQGTLFSEGGRDESVRRELAEKAEKEGAGPLLQELKSFDPESAERIHPNNISRIIRAIEIYRVTGKTMTEQNKESHRGSSPYRACMIGLCFEDRQNLYRRIDERVDQMIRAGLAEEARSILNEADACVETSLQAIGYKEFRPYFEGKITLEEAAAQIKLETRHYAKRQMTWFRRDKGVHWLKVDVIGDFYDIAEQADQIVKKELCL